MLPQHLNNPSCISTRLVKKNQSTFRRQWQYWKFGILLTNNVVFSPSQTTLWSSTSTELRAGQMTVVHQQARQSLGGVTLTAAQRWRPDMFVFRTLNQRYLHYNLFHLSCQTAPCFYIFLPASIIQGCKNNF